MSFTRREVNEFVKSQEETDQQYECDSCNMAKSADDFRIKTSYSKRYNKIYCSRDKVCRQCANERDNEIGRNLRNEPQGFYREQLKLAPFVAAEKVLQERPEAVAVLARMFAKEFKQFHQAEKDRIMEAWNKMRESAKTAAAKREKPKGRTWSDDDFIGKHANDKTTLQFSQRRIQAPLSPEAVAEIRFLYEYEDVSAAELAKRFNRNETSIYNIVSYRSYQGIK